jgi:hypothetical protein
MAPSHTPEHEEAGVGEPLFESLGNLTLPTQPQQQTTPLNVPAVVPPPPTPSQPQTEFQVHAMSAGTTSPSSNDATSMNPLAPTTGSPQCGGTCVAALGSIASVFLIVSLSVAFFIYKRRQNRKASSSSNSQKKNNLSQTGSDGGDVDFLDKDLMSSLFEPPQVRIVETEQDGKVVIEWRNMNGQTVLQREIKGDDDDDDDANDNGNLGGSYNNDVERGGMMMNDEKRQNSKKFSQGGERPSVDFTDMTSTISAPSPVPKSIQPNSFTYPMQSNTGIAHPSVPIIGMPPVRRGSLKPRAPPAAPYFPQLQQSQQQQQQQQQKPKHSMADAPRSFIEPPSPITETNNGLLSPIMEDKELNNQRPFYPHMNKQQIAMEENSKVVRLSPGMTKPRKLTIPYQSGDVNSRRSLEGAW